LVPDGPLPNCRRRHGLDGGYRIIAHPVRQCPEWVESGHSAGSNFASGFECTQPR
jgi:hypothetical protein